MLDMPYTFYITVFMIWSFFGWVIETISKTINNNRFMIGGSYRFLPLAPLYGFGGTLLYFLSSILRNYHWIYMIVVFSISIITLEFFAGIFCEKILGEKMWDYSRRKHHIFGHICLRTSIMWVFAVAFYYFVLRYFFMWIELLFIDKIVITKKVDDIISSAFLTLHALIALDIKLKGKLGIKRTDVEY